MGYDGLVGVTTQLKNAFSRIIHPFDTFVAQVRGTALPGSNGYQNGHQGAPKYPTRSARNNSQSRVASRMGGNPPSSSLRGRDVSVNGPVNGGSKSLSPTPSEGSPSPQAQSNGQKSETPPLAPQQSWSSDLSSVSSSASPASKLGTAHAPLPSNLEY